ncbi:MAG: DUF1822 family protein [Okeania sp. SIO3B5]|uniref:DUF1822 family protein n=1 Tax=Okeania sp. SIO3B5 TaxID=2607811 RepID=UPI0013FFB7E4|nr:DUF1822 family protein [Okeania sp. SIO3B5]NEO52677.1 DUF1822 family protein [Okeania sp. SIO3B5]
MSSLIETLTAIYPEQVFLEITPEDIEAETPNNDDYSYDVARRHALINRLVLNRFTKWLKTEAPIEEECHVWPSVEDLPSIWEFVNGSALTIGNTRLVLIPQEAMDTDEFSVPQEWVDIPDWLADYYLAVQVNLEQGWFRVWGFISHKTLKQKAEFDPVLRNYSVAGELLIEDLTVMWVAREFEETERAEVPALPKLFGDEFDRISEVLGKPRGYSPRLLVTNSETVDDSEVAFPKWAALMSKESLRQQLYSKLCGKYQSSSSNASKREKLSGWRDGISSNGYHLGRKSAYATRNSRVRNEIRGNKIIDLGTSLNPQKVDLVMFVTPEVDEKISVEPRLSPVGDAGCLPSNIKLSWLSQEGRETENVVQSGEDNLYLPLPRETYKPNQSFTIQVSLGEVKITEDFEI